MTAEIYFRLGLPLEKKPLKEMSDYYDGAIVNANIATYYDSWVSKFLKELGKPFFIDPSTYIYAIEQSPLPNLQSVAETKKSYNILAKYFPDSINTILQGRPVLPLDFMEKDEINFNIINETAQNFIQFQKKLEGENPSQKRLDDYASWLSDEKTTRKVQSALKFISPPYFFFESLEDPWYKINLQLQLQTKQIEREKPVFAYICTNVNALASEQNIDQILTDFKDLDGYVIWFDNFDERKQKESELLTIIKFIEKIADQKKESIILYGGYFSLLLSYKGLNISCRNLDYGEKKLVGSLPRGGGFPKKYYINFIQQSLTEGKTRVLFSLNPEIICNCRICQHNKSNLKTKVDSPDSISMFFDNFDFNFDTKKHFILNIAEERKEIDKQSLEAIITKIEQQASNLENNKIPELIGLDLRYVKRWKKVLLESENTADKQISFS